MIAVDPKGAPAKGYTRRAAGSTPAGNIMNLPTKPPPTPAELAARRAERFLTYLGFCVTCGQVIVHDMDGPFANCACPGTIEWTGEPPLLQRLPASIAGQIRDLWFSLKD